MQKETIEIKKVNKYSILSLKERIEAIKLRHQENSLYYKHLNIRLNTLER